MNMNLKKNLKSKKFIAIALAALLVIYLLSKHSSSTTDSSVPPPVVVIKKPQMLEMVEYVTQTGNVVAYNSVNLVARVEGYLNSIDFVDGAEVKKGQELFVIQPEPYMEKLKAAQATVAAQKAAYAYSMSEYARQKRMYKDNATSLNDVEKWLARTQEYTAEVAKATADAEIAAINYSYTHVLSPFDGQIGRHLVDKGNLVGNGKATNLATVEQIDPLYVYFNMNEIDLIRLRAAARARGITSDTLSSIPVQISLQNAADFKYSAKFDFVNTGLNASTGTMELRALLDNKEHIFLPGLFVQVRIAITVPAKQLTVLDTAVLYDQIGPYVLVVDKNNIVVLKRVVLGGVEQGMRAVVKGLDAQDNVIIDGLQFATPGNKVDAHESALTQPVSTK